MGVLDVTNGDLTGRLETSNISKIRDENETIIGFMDEKVIKTDYLDFDGHINQIVRHFHMFISL